MTDHGRRTVFILAFDRTLTKVQTNQPALFTINKTLKLVCHSGRPRAEAFL